MLGGVHDWSLHEALDAAQQDESHEPLMIVEKRKFVFSVASSHNPTA